MSLLDGVLLVLVSPTPLAVGVDTDWSVKSAWAARGMRLRRKERCVSPRCSPPIRLLEMAAVWIQPADVRIDRKLTLASRPRGQRLQFDSKRRPAYRAAHRQGLL